MGTDHSSPRVASWNKTVLTPGVSSDAALSLRSSLAAETYLVSAAIPASQSFALLGGCCNAAAAQKMSTHGEHPSVGLFVYACSVSRQEAPTVSHQSGKFRFQNTIRKNLLVLPNLDRVFIFFRGYTVKPLPQEHCQSLIVLISSIE